MKWSFINLNSKTRITIGLVGILMSLLFIAMFVDLIPDKQALSLKNRIALAEAATVNTSAFITHSDMRRVEAYLSFIVERNDDIASAGVRNNNGQLMVSAGEHEKRWQPIEDNLSRDNQLIVPVWAGDKQWGAIELTYLPDNTSSWLSFIYSTQFQLTCFVALFSFILFYLYLGAMLKQLDPSQAIPERVRTALDTMAEGLLVIDPKQHIVLANRAFATIMGKSADDLMGYRASDFPWKLTEDHENEHIVSPWKTALSEARPVLNTMVHLDMNGSTHRTFIVNCSPIMADEKTVNGALISFDDVTQLEQKEIELRKSRDEAERANNAKSDFLANMSHEIRTPMNAILGFTEVLKRSDNRSKLETQKHLDTIYSSGKHLLELINDILDLSKIEAGHVDTEKIRCSPHKIIIELIQILGIKAAEKNITLVYEPDGDLPESIESDPARLRQIITNLVGNSIKFTEQGGVTISTKLINNRKQPGLIIAVKDTGIGMSTEQQNKIFDPFVQAESSINRRFGGTGLGLSICKKFAEALGGDISVQSRHGEGSVFSVTIDTGPLDGVRMIKPEELLLDDSITEDKQQKHWELPAARVLVIDDGSENRELIQVVLEDAGLTVDEAENGEVGIHKALETEYDMILMDLQMPTIDGYQATRQLRDLDITIPVIALSAHAMGDVEEKCMAAGFSGYLPKPISIDALMQAVAEQLGGNLINEAQTDTDDVASITTPEKNTVPLDLQSVTDNPRIQNIVNRFASRMHDKLGEIEQARSEKNYKELSDLGHWLKGTSGMLGIQAFVQPASELELAAQSEDDTQLDTVIKTLRDLTERIRILDENKRVSAS